MTRARALASLLGALAIAAAIAVLAVKGRPPPRSPVEQVPTTWRTARETPMHVLHVGTKKLACTECHAGVGGDAVPPTAAACTKCHARQTEHGHRGNATHETTCLSCHVFGGDKAASRCIECHADSSKQGARVLEHHARDDVPCGACHEIHGDEPAVLADCTACHDKAVVAHGRFAARPRDDRDPDASVQSLWVAAAALASFREAGAPAAPFGAGGRADAGGLAVATADVLALPPGQVCATCHDAHASASAARETCSECHVETRGSIRTSASALGLHSLARAAPKITPRGARVAGHEGCVTCHDPHRARRSETRRCDSCHADQREVASVAGHAACSGCHAPHAPADARASCTTCHSGLSTLSSSRADPSGALGPHGACTSCHDPHRPKARPEGACVGCHASIESSHPTTTASLSGATARCVGCHAPHGGDPKVAAPSAVAPHPPPRVPCSQCHTSARGEHAFHDERLTCTRCHAPHDFDLRDASSTLCAKCHAPKAAAVAARPGHASCAGCHGTAHAPIGAPSCRGCHAPEASTAAKGHTGCTSCHDAHSGSLGSHRSCTSCHESKRAALHAASTPQGCADCHRPHGPKGPLAPPPCSACHAPSSIVGLHGVRAHARCASCHGAHDPPRADRGTCTTAGCHADRIAHQPEAKACNGCHLFRH